MVTATAALQRKPLSDEPSSSPRATENGRSPTTRTSSYRLRWRHSRRDGSGINRNTTEAAQTNNSDGSSIQSCIRDDDLIGGDQAPADHQKVKTEIEDVSSTQEESDVSSYDYDGQWRVQQLPSVAIKTEIAEKDGAAATCSTTVRGTAACGAVVATDVSSSSSNNTTGDDDQSSCNDMTNVPFLSLNVWDNMCDDDYVEGERTCALPIEQEGKRDEDEEGWIPSSPVPYRFQVHNNHEYVVVEHQHQISNKEEEEDRPVMISEVLVPFLCLSDEVLQQQETTPSLQQQFCSGGSKSTEYRNNIQQQSRDNKDMHDEPIISAVQIDHSSHRSPRHQNNQGDDNGILSHPPTPSSPPPPLLHPRMLLAGEAATTIPWHVYVPKLPSSDMAPNTTDACSDQNHYYYAGDGSVATEHVTLQTEILDPTEPLFYGSTSWNNHCEDLLMFSQELKQAADVMYELLCRHWESPHCTNIIDEIIAWIQQYPDCCQVRYPPVAATTTTITTSSSNTTTAERSCGSSPARSTIGAMSTHHGFRSMMCGGGDNSTGIDGGGSSSFAGAVYPLSYFCVTGCYAAVKVSYQAYPEAIGCSDACLGLPLHYACHHTPWDTQVSVIQFLISTYPDAVRRTNDVHQTPLHLSCARDHPHPDVVSMLLAAFPAAALTFDDQGYTPLLRLCQNNNSKSNPVDDTDPSVEAAAAEDAIAVHETITASWSSCTADIVKVLRMLCETSPLAVAAVTGCTMEKALHLAAVAGAHPSMIQLLLTFDPGQCRYTDDSFQLPLHKAVLTYCHAYCNYNTDVESATSTVLPTATATAGRSVELDRLLETVTKLVAAFPDGIHWTDANDERPLDIAQRMLSDTTQDCPNDPKRRFFSLLSPPSE